MGTVELADGPRTPAQQVQEVLELLTLSLVISQPFKLLASQLDVRVNNQSVSLSVKKPFKQLA